jgi:glycosyltransferase involved in cell wall biosynthesis
MRILLSAFACEPGEGSEGGVGWSWAYYLAKAGNQVTVLTWDGQREAIESKLSEFNLPNLRFEYLGVRYVPFWMPGPGVYPYYFFWQWHAYLRARQLHRLHRFDVAHHVTYAVFRNPSYLYLLGVPFIFGPVGGGETAPRALRVSMSRKAQVFEALRDLANLFARLDPFWHAMLRNCACIVVKTEETRASLPLKYRAGAAISLDNMAQNQPFLAGASRREPPFKLLYAGRLLPWKGLHLAVQAMAKVASAGAFRLTIVGKGEEERRLKEDVRRMGLQDCVEFIPWVPRSEVLALYAVHDAFLFPSLHDSGGTVVLEAISRGKPVICFDLGGPPLIVDRYCARIVGARGKTEEQAIQGLADAMIELSRMPDLEWDQMRHAAMRRAQFCSSDQVIAHVYGAFRHANSLPAGCANSVVSTEDLAGPLAERPDAR